VHWWQKPIPYLIRFADRGRYMRVQAALEELLPLDISWTVERQTCTWNGLEILVCTGMKGR
jgi:hypothetical protein